MLQTPRSNGRWHLLPRTCDADAVIGVPRMALQTPPRSSTPAPVILTGFALVGLALVMLAYRAYAQFEASAPQPFPTAADFHLGELSTLRALSLDEAALSVPPVDSPGAQWSSSVHPLLLTPEDRTEPLPDLSWPPVLAQEQPIREARGEASVSPDWSSGSHASAPPPPALPEPPPPEIPRITSPPTLSGHQLMVANARPSDPARGSSGWASRGHSLVLPPPLQDDRVLPAPLPPRAPSPELRPAPGSPARPPARTPHWRGEGAATRSALPADALAHNFTRGDLTDRRLLLSFDGGSEASSASSILDILEREGVRTTLFLTGEFIRNHPDLVHRALSRGHEIGNHTEHHRHLTTWESNRRHDTRSDVDRSVLLGELEGARQALLQLTGVDMTPFWRAPYGEVNREILRWAADAGYLHVGWSAGLDSLDWVSDRTSHHYRSPQEFLSVLTRKARGEPHGLNGTITLMHLHSNRPAADRFDRHLGETIRWLRAAGYDPVPASSLVGLTGIPGAAYRLTVSPITEGG